MIQVKQNEPSDKAVYQMEPTGHRDGKDYVPRASVTDSQMLRTLTPRERTHFLEEIRYHGVQEDQHRIRRKRFEAMIRHDDALRAANTLGTTKKTEEEQ